MKGLLAVAVLFSLLPAAWASQNPRHKVVLTWSAPAHSTVPIAGYDVYRASAGFSLYARLNSIPVTTTTYTDDTVQFGAAYSYYVVTVDAQGNRSLPSSSWSVAIPDQSWYGQGGRGIAEATLLLLMFLAGAGLIGVWLYLSRRKRAGASAAP